MYTLFLSLSPCALFVVLGLLLFLILYFVFYFQGGKTLLKKAQSRKVVIWICIYPMFQNINLLFTRQELQPLCYGSMHSKISPQKILEILVSSDLVERLFLPLYSSKWTNWSTLFALDIHSLGTILGKVYFGNRLGGGGLWNDFIVEINRSDTVHFYNSIVIEQLCNR